MSIAGLFDDFRLAARRLRQRPGFTSVAVLTLALGLGANIAIFTLVHATMFQRLPVANADELVRLGDNDNCCVNSGLQDEVSLFSYISYSNLRDHLPQLASLAAFQANPQQIGIRRTGACAVDMAWVAAGRWDAYWERALNAWDMAPGVILVQEAGGVATAVDGSPLDLHGQNVCVSNGAVHGVLIEALNRARDGHA